MAFKMHWKRGTSYHDLDISELVLGLFIVRLPSYAVPVAAFVNVPELPVRRAAILSRYQISYAVSMQVWLRRSARVAGALHQHAVTPLYFNLACTFHFPHSYNRSRGYILARDSTECMYVLCTTTVPPPSSPPVPRDSLCHGGWRSCSGTWGVVVWCGGWV
jgi:hypothetical protein